MKKFLSVLVFLGLLSIGHANTPLDLYLLDASTRGKDFFNTLTTAFTQATTAGEVEIQTLGIPNTLSNPLQNGIIPYVQQGTLALPSTTAFPYAAPNSTLFIFAYNPKGQTGIIPNITQYIVVGIEQIVTVAYRNTTSPAFPPSSPFTPYYASDVLPLYSIHPTQRAADIVDIVGKFIQFPSAFGGTSNQSQVWILTTLSGPYYVPFAPRRDPGARAIANVTSIQQLSNEFLLITYYPTQARFPWSVIVAAEQVQQIVFYPNQYPAY